MPDGGSHFPALASPSSRSGFFIARASPPWRRSGGDRRPLRTAFSSSRSPATWPGGAARPSGRPRRPLRSADREAHVLYVRGDPAVHLYVTYYGRERPTESPYVAKYLEAESRFLRRYRGSALVAVAADGGDEGNGGGRLSSWNSWRRWGWRLRRGFSRCQRGDRFRVSLRSRGRGVSATAAGRSARGPASLPPCRGSRSIRAPRGRRWSWSATSGFSASPERTPRPRAARPGVP